METAKDINLESVISYFTNIHNYLQHNSAYLQQVQIAFETTLDMN
jgi:hypothetical protein